MIGGVANIYFVVQKLITVQEEKRLRVDVFITKRKSNLIFFVILSFKLYLNVLSGSFFWRQNGRSLWQARKFRIFFWEYQERIKKSFMKKIFFLCQFFVIVLMLVFASVRLILSATCAKTAIWVAILSSTVGYIWPPPKIWKKNNLSKKDF